MFIGVKGFSAEPGLPANARATTLFADNETVVTNMTAAGVAQEDGYGRFRGASADRKQLATDLRLIVRKIGGIAKVLDTATFPDIALQTRAPRSSSYQALVASATAIKNAVTPATVKAAFVARGIAADFETELDDLVQAQQDATSRKAIGRGTRVGGTSGLLAESRRGLAIVRELDAIMQVILAADIALLAKWNSVSHVQRAPQREPAVPGSTTPGSGSPDSGSTITTTTNGN